MNTTHATEYYRITLSDGSQHIVRRSGLASGIIRHYVSLDDATDQIQEDDPRIVTVESGMLEFVPVRVDAS